MKVKSESEVAQSCPTPSDPMDCSPPGSSIHGIFQGRVLEWGGVGCQYLSLEEGKYIIIALLKSPSCYPTHLLVGFPMFFNSDLASWKWKDSGAIKGDGLLNPLLDLLYQAWRLGILELFNSNINSSPPVYLYFGGFPGGSDGKESACNVGDLGLIPGLGRSPGGEHGNPLQYSCLENPMNRRAWWATVLGVAKSWAWLSAQHSTFVFFILLILRILSHLPVVVVKRRSRRRRWRGGWRQGGGGEG